jgi:ornithine cyclodeaminase/alanine dehydrogenase-like protein (mu-crystallin family)
MNDMTATAIWLNEQDVTATVSVNDTIVALESGLAALSRNQAHNIPKALTTFSDGSSAHSLGSVLTGDGYCGYKNWVHTKRGAKAVFVLFDANNGSLLAMMEANSLGQLRTAAMTGVGTKWLCKSGANDMALIGTGRQAIMQVAAVHAVRPLSSLRIWSPTREKREAFSLDVQRQFDFKVRVTDTLEAATEGADIVTLVTRARDPFLHGNMLAKGTHLNAVGAILPGNSEIFEDVFERVDFIAVDDVVNTRKASQEFMDHFGGADGDWSAVHALGDVINGKIRCGTGHDVTLFKSVGMGISDLSVARMAYERSLAEGRGIRLPLQDPSPLRWEGQ